MRSGWGLGGPGGAHFCFLGRRPKHVRTSSLPDLILLRKHHHYTAPLPSFREVLDRGRDRHKTSHRKQIVYPKMGWFWAEKSPPRSIALHDIPSADLAPPVSYNYKACVDALSDHRIAWMPHAQRFLTSLDFLFPTTKVNAIGRLILPHRFARYTLSSCAISALIHPLEIKPFELYALQSLADSRHQPVDRPPNFPHHILHPPWRR